MRRRRGSLIVVLLMLALFFVLCLGYLVRQPALAGAAHGSLLESQARALALSGMDDVRCKFMKDYKYPHLAGGSQNWLSYTDTVSDLIGNRVGLFRITIDQSWAKHPYSCYRVRSEGLLGGLEKPDAIYCIDGVLDVSPDNRGPGPDLNFWEWTEWNESPR